MSTSDDLLLLARRGQLSSEEEKELQRVVDASPELQLTQIVLEGFEQQGRPRAGDEELHRSLATFALARLSPSEPSAKTSSARRPHTAPAQGIMWRGFSKWWLTIPVALSMAGGQALWRWYAAPETPRRGDHPRASATLDSAASNAIPSLTRPSLEANREPPGDTVEPSSPTPLDDTPPHDAPPHDTAAPPHPVEQTTPRAASSPPAAQSATPPAPAPPVSSLPRASQPPSRIAAPTVDRTPPRTAGAASSPRRAPRTEGDERRRDDPTHVERDPSLGAPPELPPLTSRAGSDAQERAPSATELLRRAQATRRLSWLAAVPRYQELISKFPRSTEAGLAEMVLAKHAARDGRWERAVYWFREHQRRPESLLMAEALWGEAQALESLGRSEERLRSLRILARDHATTPYGRAARQLALDPAERR